MEHKVPILHIHIMKKQVTTIIGMLFLSIVINAGYSQDLPDNSVKFVPNIVKQYKNTLYGKQEKLYSDIIGSDQWYGTLTPYVTEKSPLEESGTDAKNASLVRCKILAGGWTLRISPAYVMTAKMDGTFTSVPLNPSATNATSPFLSYQIHSRKLSFNGGVEANLYSSSPWQMSSQVSGQKFMFIVPNIQTVKSKALLESRETLAGWIDKLTGMSTDDKKLFDRITGTPETKISWVYRMVTGNTTIPTRDKHLKETVWAMATPEEYTTRGKVENIKSMEFAEDGSITRRGANGLLPPFSKWTICPITKAPVFITNSGKTAYGVPTDRDVSRILTELEDGEVYILHKYDLKSVEKATRPSA